MKGPAPADVCFMNPSAMPAEAQHEIQFQLSLLHILNPGQPSTAESDALEQLLTVKTTTH